MLMIRAPRIELGTYCVLGSRHNQLDQARIFYILLLLYKKMSQWCSGLSYMSVSHMTGVRFPVATYNNLYTYIYIPYA